MGMQYRLLEPNRLILEYFSSISQHRLGKLLGQKYDRVHLHFQHSALCMPSSGSSYSLTVKMLWWCLAEWITSKGCTLCTDISHLKLFDFMIVFLMFQQFNLSPEQLSTLIECKLSGNKSYSKEMWKLFFSRFSANLGDALQMLSNTVKTITHSQSAVWQRYTLACECTRLCKCVCLCVGVGTRVHADMFVCICLRLQYACWLNVVSNSLHIIARRCLCTAASFTKHLKQ